MDSKQRLGFWQIWNMSFGFLGIQFGFALQNANVSRIFETLGADESGIPILWLAAPVTGLLVQPVIGYMSDRTWCFLGRRRPYFLVGALLASCALIIMPNVSVLWMAAGMLWVMDASINISMEPFRALVGDLLPAEQRTKGFAMQSFFIGSGAVIASMLPYLLTHVLNIPNTAPRGSIPPSVRYSFYMGALAFTGAVLWTVIKTKEHPPVLKKAGFLDTNTSIKKENIFKTIAGDIIKMPATMLQLAVVQFFSWFALFSMWIYMTPAVTSYIYHSSDTTSAIYNEGANWVGVLFAVYNGAAAVLAFALAPLASKTSRKMTHAISLLFGAVGLVSVYFVKSPEWLIVSMLGVGFAWAGILSMPYAILTGAIPSHKMGFYMGVFNFFIVIPQIVAASLWGFIIKSFFSNEAIFAIVLGGVSFFIAALTVYFVKDN